MNIAENTEAWDGCKVSMGWTAGSDLISRLIRSSDKVLHEGELYKAKFNHIFWHFNWEHAPSIVYESHKGAGVQLTPWEHIINNPKILGWKLHPMELEPEQAHKLYLECTKLHGKAYDIRHIIRLRLWLRQYRTKGLTLDDDQVPPFVRDRLEAGRNSRFICNELVYRTGSRTGLDMGRGLCTEITSSPEMLHLAHVGLPSALTDPAI